MSSKLDTLAERVSAPTTRGGRYMWHMAMVHEVLRLLERGETVDRERLRTALTERRGGEYAGNPILQDACDEALVQLDRPWPEL